MAEFPALPLWTDAYLADTRHLKRDQHGAYLLLLMEAWRRIDCSLPDDDKVLATLACASPEEWARLKPVVMAFWKRDGRKKVWRQKRLSSERSYVEFKRASNRHKAVSRWKHEKKQYTTAMPEGMPNACRNDAPTPTPTPTPTPIEERGSSSSLSEANDSTISTNEKYAVEHGRFRLTHRDLEQWQRAFPHVAVEGQCLASAPWASREPRPFHAMAGRLAKLEREATRTNGAAEKPVEYDAYWQKI
jgi:uncharacterized protein YdaU (DUF1376 family)